MYLISRILSVLLIFGLLAGCGPGAVVGGRQVAKSDKSREAAPQVPTEDRDALSSGNQAFALDLYHALEGEGNLFYSPYSISVALAMTYAGARGETERQMTETLHFTLPQDRLHPAFNAVDQALASRKDSGGQGADGEGFRLNIVNDIWGQQDYTFQPDFLDRLALSYGAGLRLMDFQKDPDGARQAINDYIAEQTEDRIQDLIAPGLIDSLTRLVLTNAIYFNAAWLHQFDPTRTADAPFTRLDGSQVTVDMMELADHEYLLYGSGEDYQAVALPYENEALSMLVLLPGEGQFASFESSLNATRLAEILDGMQQQIMYVHMPKFEMEDDFSLSKPLVALGMQDAFAPAAADFSGMDGTRELYISEVVHKSFVKVDEAGTEAAAATAVIVAAGAMMEEPPTLVIDRPFLFFIYDQPTGTILFMGRVVDPVQ